MKKRIEKYDDMLRRKTESLLKKAGYETDYKIFCCDNNKGYCHYDKKIIVIPLWAIRYGKENCKTYWIYYLSHELAHAISKKINGKGADNHGLLFMNIFKEICPKYLQKFELTYKPRNAKAAGIKR